MSLRHTLARTGMVLAVGTLIAAAGAGPALAAGKPTVTTGIGPGLIDDTGSLARDWDSPDWDNGDWNYGDDPYFDEDGLGDFSFEDPFHDGRPDDHRRFEGRILSRDGLALHNRPDRRSRIIRIAPHDERVHIYCKTRGERVGGNPIWYLITDGTWSWGPAQHIANTGPSPRWC
ncbi:SH3 domain-containing protein [Streptomyces sp. RLB3-17]|uniref:SH3 domain-containing protein n=1 Tax=Streptomyces TaxID=1883 RepID=UPI0011657CBA|nr:MULTISPECIES: SH3 domain-containing protein [unclassified Streptomyces]NMI60914.1 SH3 domain-containing protein [Streptomyces sp. RLA2-12]QDN60039.1 SH3 domain-containing protein [Streptomyces sp. S1D4-20]QDN70116.1 SH3 domain-containing protein [Streptomyces sp. S1D4-14]QDO00741.1 SH3 domain-containing protein [Streptomyces sp. RLB1-9]QDO22470.1 SH3 domain-containing protein [Streptomyces sp. S1A1-8]